MSKCRIIIDQEFNRGYDVAIIDRDNEKFNLYNMKYTIDVIKLLKPILKSLNSKDIDLEISHTMYMGQEVILEEELNMRVPYDREHRKLMRSVCGRNGRLDTLMFFCTNVMKYEFCFNSILEKEDE